MHDELRAQQLAFTAHMRDPEHNAAPAGIEERRLAVYRDLLFNSLESLLSSNFPVIRKTLGNDAWRALVRDFYAHHRCATPLFTEVGKEFADYLAATRGDDGWLSELAHYEYAELALAIADAELPPHDPGGDPVDGIPVASPFAWPLAYRWPVHRIGPDFQPHVAPEQPTLLLLRRDANGDVRFSELSAATFALLQRIDANTGATGAALVESLASEAAASDREAFLRDGAALLTRLREDGVLLGTSPRC